MDEMRDMALDLMREKGLPHFYPEVPHKKVYTTWLENLRDWTISRQLWWGHQIPAWYDETGKRLCRSHRRRSLRTSRHDRANSRPRRSGHLVLIRLVAVLNPRLDRVRTTCGSGWFNSKDQVRRTVKISRPFTRPTSSSPAATLSFSGCREWS